MLLACLLLVTVVKVATEVNDSEGKMLVLVMVVVVMVMVVVVVGGGGGGGRSDDDGGEVNVVGVFVAGDCGESGDRR